MTEYVSKLVESVHISGSLKRISGNYVEYSYVFEYENGDTFYPDNIGMKVIPINECFAELAFADYRTFATCNPVRKYEAPQRSNDEKELALANNEQSSFDLF